MVTVKIQSCSNSLMSSSIRLIVLLALSCLPRTAISGDNELTAEEKQAGWKLLFDGRTTDGWLDSREQPVSSDHVQDGSLNPHRCNYMLIHKDVVDNFVLSLDFRISQKCNSGIFVRTFPLQPRPGKDVGFNGIEVAIDDTTTDGFHDTGAIYDLVRPRENAMKPAGEWNHMEITCDRNTIHVLLNGRSVTKMDLDQWTLPNKRPDGSDHKFDVAYKDHPRQGYIGLQDHGSDVWYRNIKLLPLRTPASSLKRTTGTEPPLTLSFEKPHTLVIHGTELPGREIRINYLEAYCRANSTDADWVKHTVIPHTVELLSLNDDRTELKLRDTLQDGVTVEHTVTAGNDEIRFHLKAHNPGTVRSEAHWAQACVRLADFTGFDPAGKDLDDYLPKCFLFLDGKLTRFSDVKPWAKEARYIPGQVWAGPGVPRTDVNPRPLSPLTPSNGLIGAFSADETMIFATAWDPWQELFQGVARCLHSDFRLAGLQPGETKIVQGRIYLLKNDVPALLARYAKDFPSTDKP